MKHFFCGFLVTAISLLSFGQNECFTFLRDYSSSILLVGKYCELINKQGYPSNIVTSHVGITKYKYAINTDSVIDDEFKIINVEYLTYGDSIIYIKRGDSIQVSCIFFDRSSIWINYDRMIIDRDMTFEKAFIYFRLNGKNEDYDFYEPNNDVLVDTRTFGIHTKDKQPYDDNLWFVFYKENNRLWRMDFPLSCEGSIIR